MSDSQPRILIVDDNRELADAYRACLSDQYDTDVAYSGRAALEQIDDDVDLLILDRRMPDVSGDEVLAAVTDEFDCRVIMLTAVDADPDIVSLPYDAYLVKPLSRDALVETVEQQLSLAEADKTASEFVAVTSTLTALRRAGRDDQSHNERIEQLRERKQALETELGGEAPELVNC